MGNHGRQGLARQDVRADIALEGAVDTLTGPGTKLYLPTGFDNLLIFGVIQWCQVTNMDDMVRALMEQIKATRRQLHMAKDRGAMLAVSRRMDALVIKYHQVVSPVRS